MTVALLPIYTARNVPRLTAETRAYFLLRTEPTALRTETGRMILAELKDSDNAAIANAARQLEGVHDPQ